MAALTPSQKKFLAALEKSRGVPWFRRNIKTGKEQCFIGSKRKVNSRTFFFFYGIGYFECEYHCVKRKYEYYDMRIVAYKLEDYLNDFKMPYVIPE